MRKQFRDLADPEDLHAALAGLDLGGGTERVSLEAASGRVLAERVDADLDVPGFDRASLDGYALRARDTFGADEADPAELDLVGAVHAGEEPDDAVGEGETVEVSTGAVMPPGADAMVAVERTDREGDTVEVRTAVTPGENVMLAGADIAAGERALGPGTRLTAREIGLLSALGVDAVPVRGRPTVGIVSTGDELVRPGDPVDHGRGQIYDVNSYTIATGVREAGGDPELYPHVGDDYDDLERVLTRAAGECDLVCSSGSTSAGAVDAVYQVIEDRGELLLHGVAVKPGKPTLVGELGGAAYVGLPGYPVSALSIFRTFVAPAIREAAGYAPRATASVEGRLARRERYAEGRLRLIPVGLVTDGETLVYPVDKGSGATTSLVAADGVVEMAPGVEYLDAGEAVTVDLFSPEVEPPALLGVGEDDPALTRLLDRVRNPRYLSVGTRGARRWLDDGLPDVVVVAGEDAAADLRGSGDDGPPLDRLGGWTREWGLVVPAGDPEDVSGLADLVDRDLSFVNRGTESGLRTALGNAVAALADERGVERHAVVEAIDGFDLAARAHESPARRVLRGERDAGLGLRATAAKLDLGFVPLGDQPVSVLAVTDRTGKPGVEALSAALDGPGDAFESLPGYTPES